MNTNLHSQIPSPRSHLRRGLGGHRRRNRLGVPAGEEAPQPQSQPSPSLVSRAEFYAEMLATRERMHANHLAMLEKLDANHRELLAALERQATRINALEAGLARVDERTRK